MRTPGGHSVKETHVAEPVVDHYRSLGYEVYQEVGAAGRVADVVATRGPLLVIVEVKVRLSFAAIDQAIYWRMYAHRSFVAAPPVKNGTPSRRVANQAFPELGIGLLEVNHREYPEQNRYDHPVREVIRAPLRRRVRDEWVRNRLDERHKHYIPAGTAGGRRWTAFRRTAEEVNRYVRRHPGCTLQELVDGVDHHYSSEAGAKSCLVDWMRKGVIPGVDVRKESRRLHFYPKESND